MAVMKVARLYDSSDIRFEDEPIPQVGPGEALVKTRACGICSGDIMGWYMKKKAPLVFGHEPTGEVVAVGSGVFLAKRTLRRHRYRRMHKRGSSETCRSRARG